MTAYTCPDAAKFDPAMRMYETVAHQLFNEALTLLQPGATYDNIEFDTECNNSTNPHTHDCMIKQITVRRRSDGPNGDDVYAIFFSRLSAHQQGHVRSAHKLGHDLF